MANLAKRAKDELTLENVLKVAISTPGVKIHRDVFLRKELIKYCAEETVDLTVRFNPAKAGISKELINKVSKTVIDYETTKVTALSVAASLPSSGAAVAAVGAATADITSYFVFVLRTVQELAYLYGFEQFDFTDDNVDSETMNFVMIFLGTMFGVQGASSTLNALANTVAKHITKTLENKALTKGVVYPMVKEIAKKIGIKMTKQIFADTVASAIPIAGCILSGGLTLATFRPNCMKLRHNLMNYNLCDPDFYRIIDVKFTEVDNTNL